MVVYEKGETQRAITGSIKIKTVAGPDDYACMREVLTRRFRHGMEEAKELSERIWRRNSEALPSFRICC